MSAEDSSRSLSESAASAANEPKNPWLGLASYTEQDKERFFGREREIADVLRLIDRDALTVVFGRSGLGKTSLLRAGVIPQLQNTAYFSIALRLDYSGQGLSPVKQLIALAREAARAAGFALENDLFDNPEITLWEFFHTVEFWSPRNDQLKPILFIDQFEEVFTIGRNVTAAAEFLEQLADLIENRIPEAVQRRVEESGKPLGIDATTRDYKVVLSLREDFVSKLDSLRSSMPSIMRNRFALEPLSGERALAVIVQAGGSWVAPGVAKDIVAAVAGRTESVDSSLEYAGHSEIEPAYLSVMCHELFRRMLALGRTTITRDLVKQEHGGILEGLYERSFDGLGANPRVFVEDRLLTAGGFRAAVPLAEAYAEGMGEKELEILVDRRLLRFEDRLGISHVELSHDLLTGVVLKSRDERRAREALEKEAERQAQSRRAFRTRVKTASAVGIASFVVLGVMAAWALHEQAIARQQQAAEKQTQAELGAQVNKFTIEKNQFQQQILDQNKELDTEKKQFQEQMDNSDRQIKGEKEKTQELAGANVQGLDFAAGTIYQDALNVIDTYNKNLDESVKQQLNSSLKVHRSNLAQELKLVEENLKTEPDNPSAKALKMQLLFDIADIDSRAYGFDEKEYASLLAYAEPMLNEKDPWLQAKALLMIAQAAGIMYEKDDTAGAKKLLDEVRLKGEQLLDSAKRASFTAGTWDALEDVYEKCAKLQEDKDPKEARSWFVLAVKTENSAAQMESRHLSDAARISDMFGDFEATQRDYEGAIREYTAAIDNSREVDRRLVTYIEDRGDAEINSSHIEDARRDYNKAESLVDKLDDSDDSRYMKLVALERIGKLEMTDKHYDKALEWYRKEKQIALALAQNDIQRRRSLAIVYIKVCDALRALLDTKGERAELVEQVANFEKWALPNDEADLKTYIQALTALGDFDSGRKDYQNALRSYSVAVEKTKQVADRWPTSANLTLQWQTLLTASSSAEQLHEKDLPLNYIRESMEVADALPADYEKRDGLLVYSQIRLARIYEGRAQPEEALKVLREAKPSASKSVAKNCADNLEHFHQVEDVSIKALVQLKRSDEAQAEGREAMQLAETNCSALEKTDNQKIKDVLASFWGGLGYSFTMAGADALALKCDERGLSIDGNQTWIKVNLAHAYLFSGRVDDAKHLYNEIKAIPSGDHLFSQDIRDDFKELRSLGRDHPAMDSILSMIQDPGK